MPNDTFHSLKLLIYSPCPRRKEIDTLSGVVRGTSANRRRQFSGASSVSSASSTISSSGPSSIAGSGIHDPRSSNNNSEGIGQVPQSPVPSPKFGGRHSIGGNSRGSSPVHHPSVTGGGGSLVSPAHENILMGSPQHNRQE